MSDALSAKETEACFRKKLAINLERKENKTLRAVIYFVDVIVSFIKHIRKRSSLSSEDYSILQAVTLDGHTKKGKYCPKQIDEDVDTDNEIPCQKPHADLVSEQAPCWYCTVPTTQLCSSSP